MFETVSLDENDKESSLSVETPIKKEGSYYLVFLYAPLTQSNPNKNETQSLMEGPKPFALITELDSYVSISGTISFINSYGYLNAELKPMMTFYMVMFFVYLLVGIIWNFFLQKYRDQQI